MSGQQNNDGTNFSRRTFMKTTGLLAAAGAAGAGVPAAAAHGGFHDEFANWRVREAKKVWDRGYRGRPDRAIGLTDSGIDSRHPDLGPWNGIQATVNDGELVLTGPNKEKRERVDADKEPVTNSGTIGPGTFATGDEVELVQFEVTEDDVDELDATLSWSPFAENANDLELRLDIRVVNDDGSESWEAVKTAATGGHPEKLLGVQLQQAEYRFVAEQYKNITCQYELEAEFFKYEGSLGTYDDDAVFDEDGNPQTYRDTGGLQPKTIGWFNETSRYGSYDKPRDPDGHGSHCASIMGGSGRASQPDRDTVIEEEPRAVLTAGDTLEYEIEADAGTGVYISAYGDGIELIIEGPDGRELDSSVVTSDASEWDNNVAEAPAEQSGTYTTYVRAAQGELASTARVEKVSTGAFLDHTNAPGERTDEENDDTALHAGVAPNASLVGMQGLSDPTISLGDFAQDLSSIFNLRTVNMSWGYVGGLPLGAFGQNLDGGVIEAIKKAANAGILSVAAAGNAATPANGNGAPGVADEAISVVSTGPLDGIVAYSSGGIGANDEDGEGTYMKPDVTAPGGSLTDLINAADVGDAGDDSLEHGDVRDYTGKAGTSMAAPFTNGVAGLLAEAMEFDAPEELSIREPEKADYNDVKKLKHVLLSTASETAFTAAPYHRAHNPVYTHGGRDPYEGYGRINPDAAVDAVTRELLDTRNVNDGTSIEEVSYSEEVGLGIPEDSRAVAGYVQTRGGSLEVDINFSHYSGGNKAMAKEAPHLDLFVYDSDPGANGEPSIVASDQGESGTASVSVNVDSGSAEDGQNEATYFVVAKLVNVPGVVNGYDVQANFDLNLNFTAGELQLPAFTAEGSREVDSSVVSGRQANTVKLTVSNLDGDAVIRDRFPEEWRFLPFGEGEAVTGEDGLVEFTYSDESKAVPASEVDGEGESVTFTYFVEAEDSIEDSDIENYGPAIALPENAEEYAGNADFAGEDDVILVGVNL